MVSTDYPWKLKLSMLFVTEAQPQGMRRVETQPGAQMYRESRRDGVSISVLSASTPAQGYKRHARLRSTSYPSLSPTATTTSPLMPASLQHLSGEFVVLSRVNEFSRGPFHVAFVCSRLRLRPWSYLTVCLNLGLGSRLMPLCDL